MRSIESIIRFLIKRNNQNINTSFPAIVVGTQKISDGLVDVQPIVNFKNRDSGESQEYPVIKDVSLVFPSTLSSSITTPVNQGDSVLLVAQSVDISKFKNGLVEKHDPRHAAFGNLSNVVAIVGFTPYQQSPLNPNNYKGEFDNQNLNIVHNKNTDNESSISINIKGEIILRGSTKVVVEAKDVQVVADTINANNATISTDGDVLIQGQSVNRFMKLHTHIDGQGSPTSSPTPLP